MEERQVHPTVVKQALWLGLVAALVVLAVSACGGGGSSGGSAEEQREEAKAVERRVIPH